MSISIRCHGEYYARDGQLKLTLAFDEVVKAPSLSFFTQTTTKLTGTDDNGQLKFRDTTFINVRGLLKKKLLPIILNKKFPGRFVRVRGVTIDEITSDDPAATSDLPINLMSFTQIGSLLKQRNIPLDVASYVNIDELRTDAMEYMEDPEAFQRNFQRKAKKREEERQFMELNNLMPPPTGVILKTEKVKKGLSDLKDLASAPPVAPF